MKRAPLGELCHFFLDKYFMRTILHAERIRKDAFLHANLSEKTLALVNFPCPLHVNLIRAGE